MRGVIVRIVGVILWVTGLFFGAGHVAVQAAQSSMFIVSPMAGVMGSEVSFSAGAMGQKTVKENGMLQGLNIVYTDRQLTVGNLIHTSKTDSSNENGYLLYTQYYFRSDKSVQPMVGFYAERISIYSQLSGQASSPFSSLDVNTSVLSLQPVAGLSFVGAGYRVTPFAGYFNEQVETTFSSPGMRIGGQNRNGIKSEGNSVLDYASLGSKFELSPYRFLRFDMKFYYRVKQGSSPLFTTRNQINFFLSRTVGLSIKFDYFQDTYESLLFTFIGPSFVF